jgi:hypothetical protein
VSTEHEWIYSDTEAGINPFCCVARDVAAEGEPPTPVIEAPAFQGQEFEDMKEFLLDACAAEILRLAQENRELKAQREQVLTPFQKIGADRLADEVASLVTRGYLDSRSAAADALLDYREPPRTARSDRLAKLDALLASERPPQALEDAYYGRGGGPWTPMERVWRWLRDQVTTARESGLSQGGAPMSDDTQAPEPQTTDPEQESAQQEPAGSTATDPDPGDCA